MTAVALLLAACGRGTATPVVEAPVVIAKRLATLEISATPNPAQLQATQLAVRPTLTPPATVVATATPYIGVFLGEAEAIARDDPIINPALFGDTLPLDTATPNPGTVCVNEPDAVFGTAWQGDAALTRELGCPTELVQSFAGSMQLFERGAMYFRPPTGEIWAIGFGTAAQTGRFWYVEQAPAVEQQPVSAPEGRLTPALGFGAVWQGVAGVRDALGFARLGEQGGEIMVQRFEGGMLLLDRAAGELFALVGRNAAFGPFSVGDAGS